MGKFVLEQKYSHSNVECIFHPGIRQVEPLLNEISRSMISSPTGRRPLPAFANAAQQAKQTCPRNNLVHLVEKPLPLALATLLLKTPLSRKRPLKMSLPIHTPILCNQGANRELVRRLPNRLFTCLKGAQDKIIMAGIPWDMASNIRTMQANVVLRAEAEAEYEQFAGLRKH